MPVDPRVASATGRLAYAHSRKPQNPDEIRQARTGLEEAKVRAWLDKTLATAPSSLTPETRSKLARLLTSLDGDL